jgi:hypothetical protein
MSVKDYDSTLRYTPEERKSHQHRGGSLKLRTLFIAKNVMSVMVEPDASMEHRWTGSDRGKPKYSEEPSLTARFVSGTWVFLCTNYSCVSIKANWY